MPTRLRNNAGPLASPSLLPLPPDMRRGSHFFIVLRALVIRPVLSSRFSLFRQVLPECPNLSDFRFSGTRSGQEGSAAVVQVGGVCLG